MEKYIINNYKEKALLIAHYFCEKSKKELSAYEVFDMWSNWFKNDFRVNGKPVFCVVDDKLVYRKSVKMSDKDICQRYNYAFQNIYKWIKKSVENENNSKQHFKDELDRERRRGFAKLLALAKPLGLYVTLGKKDLYKNKLGYYQIVKGNKVVISGDCDKVIEHLEKMKKESV